MDEVENPDLPAAGESSPTLRPLDEDIDSAIELGSPPKPPADTVELEYGLGNGQATSRSPPTRLQLPPRPPLTREGSAPPPSQPPPAPPEPSDFPQDPPDSLTLADLKRIRSQFPNAQQLPQRLQVLDYDTVYDFEYDDAQSLPVELEEWFSYSDDEQDKLRRCQAAFKEDWAQSEAGKENWLDVTEDVRRAFVTEKVEYLANNFQRNDAVTTLMSLTYIGLGIWDETAGHQANVAIADLFPENRKRGSRLENYASSSLQLQWIVAMIDTLHACNGLKVVYNTLRTICEDESNSRPVEQSMRNDSQLRRQDETLVLWCCLTLLYLFVEVARATPGDSGQRLREDISALQPNLLAFLTQTVARLRWDEYAPVPLTKMLLLAWKTILVIMGGIKDVENVKASLHETHNEIDARGQPIITASPLDYHLFRQEISSKYPAYQPPAPLFPLEPENNSILPPLKHRRPSYAASVNTDFAGAPNVGTSSIMHQPVHIATPAPSPPPSPGGPGKAGKKQNYQTNQMFPFLYPPLDPTSNDLGGKGSTELQDVLVGRKWEGSDVPTSILEAAELFAQRMRATRAMKQLWEARVDYMKFERGWKGDLTDKQEGEEVQDDEDEDADNEPFELVSKPTAPEEETATQGEPLPQTAERRRLNAANTFYHDSLPHLQSVVIVLLKAVLQNVTDIVTKGNGQNGAGLQAGIQFSTDPLNGGANNTSAKPIENGTSPNGDIGGESTAEELDKLRTQEIASKALSAILLLLLKWFKISHVLQYEYLTQLLLDSNYVPLVLKLWQTQEIGRSCHYRLDRDELNFFRFCLDNSREGRRTTRNRAEQPREDEGDDAAPPPIKLKRSPPPSNNLLSPTPPDDFNHAPEVDELGYPTTPLPSTPLQNYSWRNIFASINFLRILQKVTRRKTHRALLLVSYKSSNHLKKSLKTPIHLLRYYTLKLFKSQVPFCGRKWRQGNMKIITAVWLSVPAELRDDWLQGGGGGMGGACVGDVDGTVEDALPLEQSLRALTHWWNVRNFGEAMGVQGLEEAEEGFFARELERMEIAAGAIDGEVIEDGEMGILEEATGWQGPIEGY